MAFLSERERLILAHLLEKRQRMIAVRPDGEEATGLIARGYFVVPVRHPRTIHRDVHYEIPDFVWAVLEKHKAEFAYRATDGHPWRTPWAAR